MEETGNRKKIFFLALAGLGLYFLSAGISYAFFSYVKTPPSPIISPLPLPSGESKFRVDLSAPKTEMCPLNGKMSTKEEKNIWSKRRPLTVMIENHKDSRPQSGLSSADVVYEAVAEGGITRFLAIFYCGVSALDAQVGPVRSARTYFLDFASEYGDFPLYAHVGGANTPGKANALGQIGDYGWLRKGNDLNQFSIGFPTFWRDYERLDHPVATEHTMYSTTDKLFAVAEKRGLTNVDENGVPWDKNFSPWEFKEDAKEDKRGIKSPGFSFWKGYSDYDVKWEYDPLTNDYKRINGGIPQKDRNNEAEIRGKVIAVVFMKESRANDGYEGNLHLLYGTKGNGKALVFQDGQVVEGTWDKKDRQSRMIFRDLKGEKIKFNRGQIWIEVLPAGSEVIY